MSMQGAGAMTIGAILKNPVFLVIFAIGLIVFAFVGLALLITMPHIIVMFALFILAFVILTNPGLLAGRPVMKLSIGLLLVFLAICVFIKPAWFGLAVMGAI